MAADIRIRWLLDVVDRGAGKRLLAQDRQLRRSLQQTDTQYKRTANAATSAASRQAAATGRAAQAQHRGARATTSAAAATRRLSGVQASALQAARRAEVTALRTATAYDRQAGAARRLSVAERSRAAAQSGGAGAGAAGAAAAGGAALRRGGALVGVAGVGVAGAGALRAFVGFEAQMDRVQAVATATTQQLGLMTRQAKTLGRDTAFSAKEAADGMYQLATAGFSANDVMRIIPGTLDLASASAVDLATAAELQAAALRGFGLDASQAARVADVLTKTVNTSAVEMLDLQDSMKYIAPVAKATGQSFEDMLAAIGLMGNVGIKGSQAGTSLRTALVRLTDPPKKAAAALDELGIKAGDLRGPKGLLPLPRIMEMIATGAGKVDKGTRNAALAAIFGREALSGMIAMVEAGPKALRRQIRALEDSEGAARNTARTMRSNIAGAWDEFTGSVETTAIALVERFSPAIQDALRDAADLANQVGKFGGDFLAGLGGAPTGTGRRGQAPIARFAIGPGGPQQQRARAVGPRHDVGITGGARGPKELSAFQRAGEAARDVLAELGRRALDVGRQVAAAFEPARPMLENVILPLLKGVAVGVGVTIVGAFRVAIPVIRAWASAWGFVGKLLAPLRGAIETLGFVIGFVGAQYILKGIGLLGKFGGVFRVVAAAARLLNVPIRLVGAALGGVLRIGGAVASFLGRRLVGQVTNAASAFIGLANRVKGAGSRIFGAVRAIVSGVGRALGGIGNAIRQPFSRAINGVIGFLRSAGERFFSVGKTLWAKLASGIRSAVGAGIGFAADLGKAIANAVIGFLNDAIPNKIPIPGAPDINLPDNPIPRLRRGGRLSRMRGGGAVPFLAAGGEMLIDGGRAMLIPGDPRSDSTLMAARPGAKVLTASGQALLASGASLSTALALQAPHFQRGGVVQGHRAGDFDSSTKRLGRIILNVGRRAHGRHQLAGLTASMTETGGPGRRHGIIRNPRRGTGTSVGIFQMTSDKGTVAQRADPEFASRWFFRMARGVSPDLPIATIAQRVERSRYPGRYGQYVDDAQALRHFLGGRGGAGNGRRQTQARRLRSSDLRAGLVDDAFVQGIQAGQAGLTRAEVERWRRGSIGARPNPIIASVLQAAEGGVGGARSSRPTRGTTTRGGIKFRAGGGWGGSRNLVMQAIEGIPGRKTYKRGSNHPLSLKNPSSDHNTANKTAFASDISPGSDSIFGRLAQRLGIAARKGAWNKFLNRPIRGFRSQLLWHAPDGSHREHVHLGIRRLRFGGLVGRFQRGGRVPGLGRGPIGQAVGRALTMQGGTLAALDTLIGQAVEGRLYALRSVLIRAVRRGGPREVVERLQAIVSLIDFEVGRRAGQLLDAVAQRTAQIERTSSALDRNLRRQGLDPASAAALAQHAPVVEEEIGLRTKNVEDLRGALRSAQRQGNVEQVRELQAQLDAATDELDEVLVRQIELRREAMRASVQEGIDLAQVGLAGLDVQQRLAGTAETPEGMAERARAIQSTLLPALQANYDMLLAQQQTFAPGSDAWRSASIAVQTAGNDVATAMADAADLFRQASLTAAQNAVDAAVHSTTIADLGLQRLELQQRLGGSFETGGVARAEFIRTQIIPALEAELQALRDQQRAAQQAGDATLARQIAEAIFGKENAILQAQLDAQEQIAANTEALREFQGALGFEFGGQRFTDLINLGTGA
jgi:TP901 family phage tail tape measure protein